MEASTKFREPSILDEESMSFGRRNNDAGDDDLSDLLGSKKVTFTTPTRSDSDDTTNITKLMVLAEQARTKKEEKEKAEELQRQKVRSIIIVVYNCHDLPFNINY